MPRVHGCRMTLYTLIFKKDAPAPLRFSESVRLTCSAWHLQFGRIVSIDLKSPAVPPPFAFVEFDHPRCGAAAVAKRGLGRTPGPRTPGLH